MLSDYTGIAGRQWDGAGRDINRGQSNEGGEVARIFLCKPIT